MSKIDWKEYWKYLSNVINIYLTNESREILFPLAAEHIANIHEAIDSPLKPGCSIATVYNENIETITTNSRPQELPCLLVKLYKKIEKLSIDNRKKVLLFWWYSPYILGKLGKATPMATSGWNVLNHHTVQDVVDTLSAFYPKNDTNNNSWGLLLFSFSPVQPFIEGAKKLKDLWGGSYILSLFTLSALKEVINAVGPYRILLPSLRHNHMIYIWLREKIGEENLEIVERMGNNFFIKPIPMGLKGYPDKYLSIAGLPNRIVILLRENEQEDVVGAMEEAIKRVWREIARKSLYCLSRKDCFKIKEDVNCLLEEELKTFPQIYHSFVRLSTNYSDVASWFYESREEEWHHVTSWFNKVVDGNTKNLHPSTYMVWHIDAVNAYHNSVKTFTPYYPYHVKIERPPLYLDDLSGKAVAIAERTDNDGRHDRFGVASLSKRYISDLALSVIKDNQEELEPLPTYKYIGYDTRAVFPSVSWVAGYKWIKWAKKNGKDESDVLNYIGNEKLWDVEKKHKEETNGPEEDGGDEPTPSGYYAVLMLDGDRMGAWFSATHEVISRHAKEIDKFIKLEYFKELFNGLSDEERESVYRGVVLGPAYLRNLSSAIGTFAYLVPAIIQKHDGFMVYVGGDDVLAILPPETVFDAIHDIKVLFAGGGEYGIKIGSDIVVKKGIVYYRCKAIAMITGTAHTMSGGVSLYWLKDPLMLAVRDAREGEKIAKGNGRNAVHFIMRERGGRPISGILKWNQNMKLWGVGSLLEFNNLVREILDKKKLAKSFLYEMFAARVELDAIAARRDWEYMKKYIGYYAQRHGLKEPEKVNQFASYFSHQWWQDAFSYFKILLKVWGSEIDVT